MYIDNFVCAKSCIHTTILLVFFCVVVSVNCLQLLSCGADKSIMLRTLETVSVDLIGNAIM